MKPRTFTLRQNADHREVMDALSEPERGEISLMPTTEDDLRQIAHSIFSTPRGATKLMRRVLMVTS